MLSIRTNLASIDIAASMKRNQNGLANSLERVSTGRRVNRAADDAAGLATAVNLETQIKSTRMAMRNANDGISIIQTAEGEVGSAIDNLQRLRELAVQSASETITSTERGYIVDEYNTVKFSLKDQSRASEYNGIKLLDNSPTSLSVQVGAGNGTNNRIDIDMASLKDAYIAMAATDVSTGTNARSALDLLDNAVQLLNSDRSKLGAAHNRLLSSISFSESYANALSSSMSSIIDTDYATETSNLAKHQLM
jgi:flagellin